MSFLPSRLSPGYIRLLLSHSHSRANQDQAQGKNRLQPVFVHSNNQSLRSWSFTSEGQFKEESPCVLMRFQCNLGEAQEQQHSPLSLLEKRAALMSLSSASQALLCACSGNFPLKSSRHSSASATYLSSKRQRARRKWAFRWHGFRDMAFKQSLRAS